MSTQPTQAFRQYRDLLHPAAGGTLERPDHPPPQRVLYVVSLFPRLSETFIVREIEQLIRRGVDIRIVTLKTPCEPVVQASAAALVDRLIQPLPGPTTLVNALRGFSAHPLRVGGVALSLAAGLWRQPLVLGKTLFALWRTLGMLPAIGRFDPQLVHAHWATYPSSIAWCLGRLLDRPFSFTSHAHDIFVEDHMLGCKLKAAAVAVTISRFNVDFLAQRHGSRLREDGMAVVRCGVDRRAVPDPAQAPPRVEGLIASVGRLDPIKGFNVLARSLGQLQRDGVAFRCVVVGEGGERPALEQLREEIGLGARLEMPGSRPQEAVQSLIAQASVFVMPSVVTATGNRDGIPVALMEAMAGGAAVVATRVSGIPELVEHEHTGLLVEPDDAQALAAAIERLLGDPELRARLGAAARRFVLREFEVGGQVDLLLAHFARATPPRATADAC